MRGIDMTNLIKGIEHICIKCKDKEEFAKVTEFYTTILGMDILRSWGDEEHPYATFDTGNGGIEVFTEDVEDLPQGAIRHFALATDDVDGCVAAVQKAGYPITKGQDTLVLPSDPPYQLRMAFCIGPVGEDIEFFQGFGTPKTE